MGKDASKTDGGTYIRVDTDKRGKGSYRHL